ncbi:MAG TPA: HNH endonuclease [Sphingomicrobium sp.]|nr:HNH endonuclease [Sphingomicrobium sp.]
MNAPLKSKVELLRARDGDDCWLCGGRLQFAAAPNSKKAPTIEHLTPRSLGGASTLDNLALCHPGCNRQLADRPREHKERIRAKRKGSLPKPASKTVGPAAAKAARPASPRAAPLRATPEIDWRTRFWLASVAAALFAGLSLGQLLG